MHHQLLPVQLQWAAEYVGVATCGYSGGAMQIKINRDNGGKFATGNEQKQCTNSNLVDR